MCEIVIAITHYDYKFFTVDIVHLTCSMNSSAEEDLGNLASLLFNFKENGGIQVHIYKSLDPLL